MAEITAGHIQLALSIGVGFLLGVSVAVIAWKSKKKVKDKPPILKRHRNHSLR